MLISNQGGILIKKPMETSFNLNEILSTQKLKKPRPKKWLADISRVCSVCILYNHFIFLLLFRKIRSVNQE